jgi:hypothetical protein
MAKDAGKYNLVSNLYKENKEFDFSKFSTYNKDNPLYKLIEDLDIDNMKINKSENINAEINTENKETEKINENCTNQKNNDTNINN